MKCPWCQAAFLEHPSAGEQGRSSAVRLTAASDSEVAMAALERGPDMDIEVLAFDPFFDFIGANGDFSA